MNQKKKKKEVKPLGEGSGSGSRIKIEGKKGLTDGRRVHVCRMRFTSHRTLMVLNLLCHLFLTDSECQNVLLSSNTEEESME